MARKPSGATGGNRRGLARAAAVAGAAGAPTRARPAARVTVAGGPDYVRDPTRWGSAEIAAHFPGFQHLDMTTSGAVIRLRHGGSGPPLLLLHGNPENHASWYKIAARLAQRFHVVLPDLRGYGDSSLPEPGPNHINYSFRAMAQDGVEVMRQLGHERFFLAGIDRGGRTAHRMCLDHPERVLKVALMDVLPNYYVWTNITKSWVIGTWHWGFMAQPEPFPETMIAAAGAAYFLKSRMTIRGGTGLGFLTPAAFDEYVRCYTMKTITGSCRDYRATATCDFEMDTADRDRKIELPVLLMWGARGQPAERSAVFRKVWRRFATNIVHAEAMNCGHYMQEEAPDAVYDQFMRLFGG